MVGIPKLEADAVKVQAQIALAQGEVDLASRLAINCIGIAAALGMRLRVTAGLVLLGRISTVRRKPAVASGLLRSALALGERQGYQLQIEDAQQQLMELQ